jgi:integrase
MRSYGRQSDLGWGDYSARCDRAGRGIRGDGPAGSQPAQAGPGSSERREQTVLRRELYPAMKRAGIERVGPTGEKRTFHSFRHT